MNRDRLRDLYGWLHPDVYSDPDECPDRDRIVGFATQTLGLDETGFVQQHLDRGCDGCQAEIAESTLRFAAFQAKGRERFDAALKRVSASRDPIADGAAAAREARGSERIRIDVLELGRSFAGPLVALAKEALRELYLFADKLADEPGFAVAPGRRAAGGRVLRASFEGAGGSTEENAENDQAFVEFAVLTDRIEQDGRLELEVVTADKSVHGSAGELELRATIRTSVADLRLPRVPIEEHGKATFLVRLPEGEVLRRLPLDKVELEIVRKDS